ncbi:NUDIX hydrolase [Streptomyces sp. AA4]|nr:NUDIX hydrolase [Streptomyces sp. AA4]
MGWSAGAGRVGGWWSGVVLGCWFIGGARGGVEVLLAHMGGPFWAKKDLAAWSLPKGEVEDGEPVEVAARREFAEELGVPVPEGEWVSLGEVRQSGKVVTAWAVEGDLDPGAVVPGVFEMEWPPRSGRMQEFPEVDRVEWFSLEVAREKLVKGQRGFLDRLEGL